MQLWAEARPQRRHDEIKKDMKALQQTRVANKHWVVALDHGLQTGLGRGLADFVCKRPPARLG